MFLNNYNLKSLNTFGIDSVSSKYICLKSESEIYEFLKDKSWEKSPFFILGGGSNVLFPEFYNGSIIHICNKGIKILKEDSKNVFIEVAAGENWQDFVEWSVSNGYSGIENLAYIPGCCGSSPVQNIGAYGVEVKDVIELVHFIDIETRKTNSFSASLCKFDYRNSIFKQELKNKIIITSVVYKLSKNNAVNLSYKALIDFFSNNYNFKPSVKDVYEAVISIRKSKLPDHNEIGNAGSFFKNPIISTDSFTKLHAQYPKLTHWEVSENKIKLSAAQLIEWCDWKGKRIGDAAVYDKQSLVLVNYGNACGKDILNLANLIMEDVKNKFDVKIEPEVNILF